MDVIQAIEYARQSFPFPGYINPEDRAYENVANVLMKHVPAGGHILDFGAGPCDKAAILQLLGFQCTACDDLKDDWHLLGENRERILNFAANCGINFVLAGDVPPRWEPESFDAVMLCDIIEHLHESPRDLINSLLESVKEGGHLLVTVPNAGNIRKRLKVLLGGTNLPDYASFYWHPGQWRGHVREYVRGDLASLAEYLGLEPVLLTGCDHMITRIPRRVRPIYTMLTNLRPGLKDSWLLLARKPAGWQPQRILPLDRWNQIIGRFTAYHYDESPPSSDARIPA